MSVLCVKRLRGYLFCNLQNGQPLMLGYDNASGVDSNVSYYVLVDENNFVVCAVPV